MTHIEVPQLQLLCFIHRSTKRTTVDTRFCSPMVERDITYYIVHEVVYLPDEHQTYRWTPDLGLHTRSWHRFQYDAA